MTGNHQRHRRQRRHIRERREHLRQPHLHGGRVTSYANWRRDRRLRNHLHHRRGQTSTPFPASVTPWPTQPRLYRNQGDGTENGTVTIVNLSSHTVEKTLPSPAIRTVVSTRTRSRAGLCRSPDSPYLTIVRTTDIIDTTSWWSNIVDVRVASQNGNPGNANTVSRTPVWQPCYLPAPAMPLPGPMPDAAVGNRSTASKHKGHSNRMAFTVLANIYGQPPTPHNRKHNRQRWRLRSAGRRVPDFGRGSG